MTAELATREILWNVGTLPNVVAMYFLMTLSMIVAVLGMLRHTELILSGKSADEHLGDWRQRFFDLFSWGLLQKGVLRRPKPGFAHTLIYCGFLVLLFTTTMVFLDHDLGLKVYEGQFYLGITLMSDVLGLLLLIGLGLMAHRRYIVRADLIHTRFADSFLLLILALLVVQGYLLEGLRIHATSDPWAPYSPVGLLVAKFFWFLSTESTALLHYLNWWFHTLTVFALLALIPYTKFFHVLASAVNLYFKRGGRPKGALKSPGDLEALLEAGEDFSIGLENIGDYSWKQLLDLEACTSCGRCQDACPAYLSGKPLSPKWLILDTRNHALSLHADQKLTPSLLPSWLHWLDRGLMKDFFLKGSGLSAGEEGSGYTADGEYRAANPLVQKSVLSLGDSPDKRIAGEVIDPEVFWSCTTCMACVEACPVGINHVEQIVENRRNMVLMQGEIPSEAQGTLRAIENRSNPYGPAEERTNWLDGLDVPILKEGDSVEYLYWVGCVSAYDPRKQKIARALARILKESGVSFGILGNAEGCTGDPARRLGEENLFQAMAKQNIALLKSVRFETLVANCPHCFNTIKNEYPQFGNLGEDREPEIIHHSRLIEQLLDRGLISVTEGSKESYTFHDPCYLGRYNDEYEAPRKSLRASKSLNIIEMDQSKEKGMCCGAGGGHFWMDMKVGERVNTLRVEQAAETGAKNVATACPFCMQMLEDGVKLTEREGSMEIRDIAEIVAENLVVLE